MYQRTAEQRAKQSLAMKRYHAAKRKAARKVRLVNPNSLPDLLCLTDRNGHIICYQRFSR